ncbi:MAG: polyprenyl synthetase family protein [Candidatus Methanomethylophilaceae archaeon]|nr:polyprenyl synthetase family protein [Candidatus Methanomethylophilaceae archaeon]
MNVIEVLTKKARELDAPILSYLQEGQPENMMESCRHYPQAGGKRMRPVLAVTMAQAVGGKGHLAVPFGAALEIIHNFTLVHDDVMDNDDTRRGLPSVHKVWGMPTAIISGDALFARAFEIIADLEVPDADVRRLLRLTARTVWLVAEGQQMDMNNEDKDSIDVATYIETVEKKTGVLFGAAAAGGAIIGGADPATVDRLYDYGRQLGIAFQIWDDVLGLKGDQSKLGKPVGSDIRNGKKTLIAIDALEHMPDGEGREALLAALGNPDASDVAVKEAIARLEEFGSIERAKKAAIDYVLDSKAKLQSVPDSAEKDFLLALADYAISREL